MFSRLEPILRPVIRKTEGIDAKLAIRRDESKDYGSSDDSAASDALIPLEWEDLAMVSTEALRAFLQTLLNGSAATATAAGTTAPAPDTRTSPTTLGSRATNAYQTMGRAGHDKNVVTETVPGLPPLQTDDPHPETSVLGHEFNDGDIVRVRNYVGELIELERRGVTELTIQRSLTFLDSLEQAINEGKAQLAAATP